MLDICNALKISHLADLMPCNIYIKCHPLCSLGEKFTCRFDGSFCHNKVCRSTGWSLRLKVKIVLVLWARSED